MKLILSSKKFKVPLVIFWYLHEKHYLPADDNAPAFWDLQDRVLF